MPSTVVTGCAGFIGFHTALRLLREGHAVTGLDNLDPYYEVALKEARLELLRREPGFTFTRGDVAEAATVEAVLDAARPEQVVHLAAQAGVRYSIQHPAAYTRTNLVGFQNVLEACARRRVRHLVYASSSSVYGASAEVPFSEEQAADRPVSYYAATKRANELMAHAYAHIHGLPATGLRFFTVYGPWGRPDMAPILFGRAILRGEPIALFNHGEMRRDFTYVDDVVEVITRVLRRPPQADGAAPWRVLNVGNSSPVTLTEFVATLERHLGRKAVLRLLPMQPGDVPATWADTRQVEAVTGFSPGTTLDVGLGRLARWLAAYDGAAAAAPGPIALSA
ncbi:MAG: NAD-dependent epimerase/dehydratase family protein [Anaeromyxobacter sp.]